MIQSYQRQGSTHDLVSDGRRQLGMGLLSHPELRRRLIQLTMIFWGGAVSVVAVSLMARHELALPSPAADDPGFQRAVNELRPSDVGAAATDWSVIHVLYAQCRCSQRIVEHLVGRERPIGVKERVLLVGDGAEYAAKLTSAGFGVVLATPAEMKEHYHVESAPLLVVSDPTGRVRYSGGYTREKQGPDIRDLAIIGELRSGGTPAELPTLGCAVSDELKKLINPLGLP